ncbi:super-infection exclusion protein B [Morganella morganii]|nr:hypothetical protein [Morganella morganii]
MPSWIEAVLAFLKKQISLRFAMFWFLSWMVLLLFIPSGWAEFIDSGIGKWGVPYIGTAIFLIPISFFISLMIKNTCYYLSLVSEAVKDKKQAHNVREALFSLNDEEADVIKYIFENGNSDYMDNCTATTLFSLVEKGIIYSSGHGSPLSRTYYLNKKYENAFIRIISEVDNN